MLGSSAAAAITDTARMGGRGTAREGLGKQMELVVTGGWVRQMEHLSEGLEIGPQGFRAAEGQSLRWRAWQRRTRSDLLH